MGTYASIRISDERGAAAGVVVGSDGHHLGEVLIDCAERWKNKVNDDDPLPPPGTPAEFAQVLCGEHYGRWHNGEVTDDVTSRHEFDYEVKLRAGVVDTITAHRRVYSWQERDEFLALLRAGEDPTVVGSYRRRWTVTVDPVAVAR